MTHPPFPNLSGYLINEGLYEGAKSLVFRGTRQADQHPVIIKLLKRTLPTHSELLSFRHQYNLLKDIHINGVISPLALESWEEKLALIQPDNHSVDLKSFSDNKALNLNDFFVISQQLANILDQLHQQGITHKDIKPGNIIIHPQSLKINIIDFSIATEVNSDTELLQSPDALSGTLSYLSPEQTGRMNRGIDYRTDFYSLGITFYELLSGRLPFDSDDPLELVHSHLAREPEPLTHIRPDLPVIINDIISKLLAKNAEDRYQSGAGLEADLKRCEQQWQAHQSIPSFKLGQTDVAQHFQLSEKLYGRFEEVKILLSAFDRVCEGHMEAIFITGHSGIGKTALVNEVHKPMTRSRGYFIKGKFDQLSDKPFSAISQAFKSLIKQILDENDEQKQSWKIQLQQALGQQAGLLFDLVPELEQLIGPQPVVEEIQGASATHRFHHLMQQFIQVFATRNHPLVIFLDDLQWVDNATLNLLSVLLDCKTESQWDKAHQPLLFIGAWRNNEVSEEHPLTLTLDKLAQHQLPGNTLILNTLEESAINDMVMDACHCSEDYARPLSQVIFQKTQGNPFFIHQFIHQATEEALFRYDFSSEHWHYDLAPIQELAQSDNVVDFIAARLKQLEPELLNSIKFAACFGHQFELSQLAKICDESLGQCAAHCWEALQKNLIRPIQGDYKLASELYDDEEIKQLNIHYHFAHDRIQQAAYSLITDQEKPQLHLAIGHLLKQKQAPDDPIDSLFLIVNQLNLGKSLINEPAQRIELAELNYQAGKNARRATAYEIARQYTQNGLQLLNDFSEQGWADHYPLCLKLHEEAIEVEFLLSNFTKQCALSEQLLNHTHNILDTIRTHQLHCLSKIAQNDPFSAIDYVFPILEELGVEFPESPDEEDFQSELGKTQTLLGDRKIASLLDLPLMTDKKTLAAVQLLEMLNVPLYIAKPAMYPLAVFKQVQLAINYGNTSEVIPFYGAFGYILSGIIGDIEQGNDFSLLTLSLLNKLPSQAQKSVAVVNAYGSSFYKHKIKDTIVPLREASHAGLETGNLYYGTLALLWADVFGFFASMELTELNPDFSRDIKLMKGNHQDVCLLYTSMLHQVILNLLGESPQPNHLQGNAYNIEQSWPQHQQNNDGFASCMAQLYQACIAYLFYDFDKASRAIRLAKEHQAAVMGSIFVPQIQFYDSLIQLQAASENMDSAKAIVDSILPNQQALHRLAQSAPQNFQHKYALIEAERCRVLGDYYNAQEHYDEAINGARQNKFLHEEALACELAARYYLQKDKELIAQAYLTRAYYVWAKWGARAKTEHLEEQYPKMLAQLSPEDHPPGASLPTSSTKTETSVVMDLGSVMKCAHTLSSELSLSGVLDKLLNAVMENAGAQRTILLLRDSGIKSKHISHWSLAAESRMDTQTRQIFPEYTLQDYRDIPKSLIIQAIKTEEPISLDDAREPYQPFYDDPYFIANRDQQSVLCQPILSKGQLMGLLYLENKLATHVFHYSRQQLVHMMAAQAAVSIENAQLYENLEEKVKERTKQLKDAQAQLLQHARESGMAEIAIDVMHNIGNSLTPLKTKTELTYAALHNSDLVKKTPQLMALLSNALKENKPLDESEQKKLLQITEVLPNVIAKDYESHAENLEKACDTIRRIEEFIHLQSKYTTVKPLNEYLDINELIKDALKMLDNLLNVEHIQADLQLSKLPPIFGEEYQLLQIFLGVIKNACEAMSFMPIENRKLTIYSSTLKDHADNESVEQIQLKIQDQGEGFEAILKDRIFAADYNSPKIKRHEEVKTSGFKLHACANYLIAHGGHIEGNSEGEGQGAVFTIVLPVVSPESTTEQ